MTVANLTRREFLKLAGGGACGAALLAAGCGGSPAAAPPTASPQRRESPSPVAHAADLALVKGADPSAITRAAIAAIGGMSRFVRPGDDVIIKPNICTDAGGPEYAATTNPEVVAALVTLCRSAGAKRVRVMDQPFGGPAKSAYRTSGIGAAATAAGAVMEIMSPVKFSTYAIPLGRDIKKWAIYDDVLACDVLIDVPIAKTHGMSRLTLAGKNLLGVVLEPNRFHQNLSQRVADLISVCRPSLTVVDAVRILARNGPTGGDLADVRKLDTVIAGADIVAADSLAATLFGLRGEDVPYVRAAAAMGLGVIDIGRLNVRRLAV
jgi:uncharacterized protein (DUF362 family)